MKALKYTACGLLGLLLALLAATVLWVTLAGSDLLPGFLPLQSFAVTDDSFGDVLPAGSLAIADPSAKLEAGHIVRLYDGDLLGVVDGEGGIRSNTAPETVYALEDAAGRVVYRIAGLGTVCLFLQTWRMVVWAVLALLLLGGILWAVTLPRRRRKKEVRQLIELFDYYGRKYDAEEEGIDY